MGKKIYNSVSTGFTMSEIEDSLVRSVDFNIQSNERTIEIINGSDEYTEGLLTAIFPFIDKFFVLQGERKSNYIFMESYGKGDLYNAKFTLSCKITKKTDKELAIEEQKRKHDLHLRL